MTELFNDRSINPDYPATGASFYTDPFGARNEEIESEWNNDVAQSDDIEDVQDFSEYLGDAYPPQVYAELLNEED